MIRIIENEVAAGLRTTEATSDLQHMKKSRYSQHSQMEDGELPLKYQVQGVPKNMGIQ